jgi:hypothetical protein
VAFAGTSNRDAFVGERSGLLGSDTFSACPPALEWLKLARLEHLCIDYSRADALERALATLGREFE